MNAHGINSVTMRLLRWAMSAVVLSSAVAASACASDGSGSGEIQQKFGECSRDADCARPDLHFCSKNLVQYGTCELKWPNGRECGLQASDSSGKADTRCESRYCGVDRNSDCVYSGKVFCAAYCGGIAPENLGDTSATCPEQPLCAPELGPICSYVDGRPVEVTCDTSGPCPDPRPNPCETGEVCDDGVGCHGGDGSVDPPSSTGDVCSNLYDDKAIYGGSGPYCGKTLGRGDPNTLYVCVCSDSDGTCVPLSSDTPYSDGNYYPLACAGGCVTADPGQADYCL